MRKSREPVLPKRSLLVQVIDDVPMRKNDPDSGLQSGLTSASTRSVALTSNVTIDPSALPNQSKSVGVLIAGGVLSATRTANESFAEFPRSSEATQSTVVVVNGKNSPDLCEQSTLTVSLYRLVAVTSNRAMPPSRLIASASTIDGMCRTTGGPMICNVAEFESSACDARTMTE